MYVAHRYYRLGVDQAGTTWVVECAPGQPPVPYYNPQAHAQPPQGRIRLGRVCPSSWAVFWVAPGQPARIARTYGTFPLHGTLEPRCTSERYAKRIAARLNAICAALHA